MNQSTSFTKTLLLSLTLIAALFSVTTEAQKARKKPIAKRPAVKAASVSAPSTTVEHGYVVGYNEGHLSGKSDFNANASKDHQRSTIYQDANRGYDRQYGDLSEYQRGFKGGYEIGYNDGYIGREKNERMPANLNAKQQTIAENTKAPAVANGKPRASGKSRYMIAPDTDVKLRLETPISTKTNQEGDKFTAFLVEPQEYEGATIEGHVGKIKRAGKLTGQTELALEFDRITFRDGTSAEFHAQVERIYATEQVKTIDDEGNVQTGSTTKDTTIRSAGGGALGAIIGGIAGGGKGAAIGAILGAGVGAGSVYIQGNKDLIFDPGTQMQVRTFGPKK